MTSDRAIVSVIAGLAVGISLIVIFSIMFQFQSITDNSPNVSVVTVPANASMTGGNRYEPKVIKVVIGINNTVRWTNHDSIIHSVYADNEDDPLFYNATRDQCENNNYDNCQLILKNNTLLPGRSFEFTFTRPGVFGYHGVPHPDMKGAVVVYPHNWEKIGYIPTKPALYEGQAVESVEKYLNQRVNNFVGITLYSTSSDIPSNQSRYLNVTEFFRLGNQLPLRYYPSGSSDSFYAIDSGQHKVSGKCENANCVPFKYAAGLRGKLVYVLDTAWLYRGTSGQIVDLPDGFFIDAYSGNVVATSFRCPGVKQEWCK